MSRRGATIPFIIPIRAQRRARRLLWGDAMKMHVYGPGGENSPTVLIIHPMLSSASSMKAALCDHMGSDPRFLVPDLSAHGDEAGVPYVSAAAEAAAIHEWLASHGVSGFWGVARRCHPVRAAAVPGPLIRSAVH